MEGFYHVIRSRMQFSSTIEQFHCKALVSMIAATKRTAAIASAMMSFFSSTEPLQYIKLRLGC